MIMSFLLMFKTACDANFIQEGASMCLFRYFVTKTVKAALRARLINKGNPRKNRGKSGSYSEAVNYMLGTHAIDEVILEADSQITHYLQPGRM